MKILLAAKHPPGGKLPFGGVQSWSLTMSDQFTKRGHSVTLWGPEWPLPAGRFDLGILANVKHTHDAAESCDRVVTVSHGIIPDEAPCPFYPALGVSEEVQDCWGIGGKILRQPIDTEFWSPSAVDRDLLVLYSYRAPGDLGLAQVAQSLGLGFVWLKNVSPEQARDTLRRAAVVCATGRAALEAMACGAPTAIADHRPYNKKPLLERNLLSAMRTNYSGRGGFVPTGNNLRDHLDGLIGSDQREHVLKYHDPALATEILLTA